jgi:hypothetical protein
MRGVALHPVIEGVIHPQGFLGSFQESPNRLAG